MSLTNPLIKTTLVGLAGALGPVILSAFDHPTGGLASALAANPYYAIAWGAASYVAHNLYDTIAPPPAK